MDTGSYLELCNQIIHGIYTVIKRAGTLGGRCKITLDLLERLMYVYNEGPFIVQVTPGPVLAEGFPHQRYDQSRTQNYCSCHADRDSGKELFRDAQGNRGNNDRGERSPKRECTSQHTGGALVATPACHEHNQTANMSYLQVFIASSKAGSQHLPCLEAEVCYRMAFIQPMKRWFKDIGSSSNTVSILSCGACTPTDFKLL
jgi:hypothetical protein